MEDLSRNVNWGSRKVSGKAYYIILIFLNIFSLISLQKKEIIYTIPISPYCPSWDPYSPYSCLYPLRGPYLLVLKPRRPPGARVSMPCRCEKLLELAAHGIETRARGEHLYIYPPPSSGRSEVK